MFCLDRARLICGRSPVNIICDNLEAARQKVSAMAQELAQQGWGKLLTLEFSRDSCYSACMELGLCFQRRLSRIRCIYFQTLREGGLEI